MLEVTIQTRNIELTEDLQAYVENKIGKMDRYLPQLVRAQVELTKESAANANDRNVVQVTLWGGKTTIRGEERAVDVTQAIDAVVDVLYRQVVRYKGRRFARTRQAHMEAQEEAVEERLALEEMPPLPEDVVSEIEDEESPNIVRVKRFPLHPMDPDEAILQMELLGNTFFVFFNADNGRVNVVYRRLDGNYGLLDPEYS